MEAFRSYAQRERSKWSRFAPKNARQGPFGEMAPRMCRIRILWVEHASKWFAVSAAASWSFRSPDLGGPLSVAGKLDKTTKQTLTRPTAKTQQHDGYVEAVMDFEHEIWVCLLSWFPFWGWFKGKPTIWGPIPKKRRAIHIVEHLEVSQITGPDSIAQCYPTS